MTALENPVIQADVAILPLGTANPGLAEYVIASAQVLKRFPSLLVQVNPLSTTVEGPWEDVMEAIRLMHEAPFLEGAFRVSTTIRIDDRRDLRHSMAEKVLKIEGALG